VNALDQDMRGDQSGGPNSRLKNKTENETELFEDRAELIE